jgi:ethanolaminephosphotransferase
VVATYLWNLRSVASRGFPQLPEIVSGGIATALATASVTFKLAFTSQDSPELMAGSTKPLGTNDLGVSLVTRARIVFISIGISLAYTLVSGLKFSKRTNRKFLSQRLVLLC